MVQTKSYEIGAYNGGANGVEGVVKGDAESDDGGDENKERGNWTGKADFLLSSIGYAVGLGNVWRFPYVAYSQGGGSFLLPYALMLIFAGLPLFFMEMTLGQFSSEGPISLWKVVPFFKGLGVAMVIISALVCIYYNMIIAYTLYYFFASLRSEVPWNNCRPEWPDCQPRTLTPNETLAKNVTEMWCESVKQMNENSSLYMNDTNYVSLNNPDYIGNCTRTLKSPSQCYWEYEVLKMSDGIDQGASDFQWQLVLCLILAWIVIFLSLVKGVKSSGKVVYVTATFPYIVLIILLIRNVTLDGAELGINFYITPDWEKLKTIDPWFRAAVQIFYSLGVAFGGLHTMASYNKFRNNVHRDALIVAITNCCTSVFAGFVIFAVIGHMSFKTGVPVGEAVSSGPGLAFIAYPEGIALMPVSPLWAILFFLMLFTLGLDSQMTMMETVITAIIDVFPWLRKTKRKVLFTLLLCVLLFLLGLPQCASNGVYVMELFNWYSAGFSLFIVSIFEIIAITYIYGSTDGIRNFPRIKSDIELMIGRDCVFRALYWPYWFVNWVFITPCLLVFILVLSCINHAKITYSGKPNAYPDYADGMGWFMVAIALVWIPICAVYEYGKKHDWLATMKAVFTPEKDWAPAVAKNRTGRYADPDLSTELPPSYDKAGYDGMDNPGFKTAALGEERF